MPLGRGIVPLVEVLKELELIDFNGWVVVEQDSAQLTPARSAWECGEWLRSGGWMPPISTPPSSQLLDELLSKLLAHVRRIFECDGVGMFIENEATQLLECACSDPETCWREEIPVHQRGYRRGKGVMGKVWATGEMYFSATNSPDPDGEKKSWEVPFHAARHDALCFPMTTSDKRVVGVIRCTNKGLPDNSHATKVFTDDDAAILDAIVQTAMPHLEMLLEQDAQQEAVAREIHETKMPLNALRGAYEWLGELMGANIPENQKATLDELWQWTEMLNISLDNARSLRPGRSELGGIAH